MIDAEGFFERLGESAAEEKLKALQKQIDKKFLHGDLEKWRAAFNQLPNVKNIEYTLNSPVVEIGTADAVNKKKLKNTLMKFSPWRKGPYKLFDILIDAEWRSDLKWARLENHISDLNGRKILDIGSGSGYHCWRMRGGGADLVLGIEPYLLSAVQFYIIKKYIKDAPVWILPFKMEEIPANLRYFDTVFSMGILYHRKSPFEHLKEIKTALAEGGEVVLETLTIDGGENEVLVPIDRYAKMRNVWFIPSALALEKWLLRTGFINVRLINECSVSIQEQRKTEWMTFESLNDFLDSNDNSKTVEGYPAPKRTIFIAESP